MSATLTSQMDVNRHLARRLLVVFGAATGGPIAVVAALVVGLLAGWPVGVAAGVVAGAVTGMVTARRAAAGALPRVLAEAGARDASLALHARYHNLVEGLCVAGGVPKPRLYVAQDDALNSMAAGLAPNRAALVVTTGLLDALSRIELEGVLAHELSHIRSWDIAPATVASAVAGVVGTMPGGRAALAAAGAWRSSPPSRASRREVAADLAGVALTRYPPGLPAAVGPAPLAQRIETLREL